MSPKESMVQGITVLLVFVAVAALMMTKEDSSSAYH